MLKREKCLNQHVRVDRRSAALDMSRFAPTHECALVDPHGQAASCDQPCVVLRPVPDSIDPFRLPTFAFVLAHLPAKYRESTQFLPKLTEAAPRPLRVNVTPCSDRFLQQRPLPAVNFTVLAAAISSGSPVFGFLPVRAARAPAPKEPKPINWTVSPATTARVIAPNTSSITSFVDALLAPVC